MYWLRLYFPRPQWISYCAWTVNRRYKIPSFLRGCVSNGLSRDFRLQIIYTHGQNTNNGNCVWKCERCSFLNVKQLNFCNMDVFCATLCYARRFLAGLWVHCSYTRKSLAELWRLAIMHLSRFVKLNAFLTNSITKTNLESWEILGLQYKFVC